VVKWALAFVTALAFASVSLIVSTQAVVAQEASQGDLRDPLISPAEGSAGSRFQIVGQEGWTADETVTLEFTFTDDAPAAPAEAFDGPFYRTETVTVLRDGTWSFPVVVNEDVLPFPLWRDGYIVVRATSDTTTALNWFRYIVADTPPAAPPLVNTGHGPMPGADATGIALLVLGAGVMVVATGLARHPSVSRQFASRRLEL
jgi:hypothetical protein